MTLRSYRASRQTHQREFKELVFTPGNYEKRHTNLYIEFCLTAWGIFVAFSTLDIPFYYRYMPLRISNEGILHHAMRQTGEVSVTPLANAWMIKRLSKPLIKILINVYNESFVVFSFIAKRSISPSLPMLAFPRILRSLLLL